MKNFLILITSIIAVYAMEKACLESLKIISTSFKCFIFEWFFKKCFHWIAKYFKNNIFSNILNKKEQIISIEAKLLISFTLFLFTGLTLLIIVKIIHRIKKWLNIKKSDYPRFLRAMIAVDTTWCCLPEP